jgi:DNA-binding response OmpR family regulator
MTVLLIDDDEGWRSTLAYWLEQEGFRRIEIPRAEWCASVTEPEDAAAVVLDVGVPGAEDLQLLSAIRRQWPRVPVIVTTALGESETGETARRYGAMCYLEKPFRIADLMLRLRQVSEARARAVAAAVSSGARTAPVARDSFDEPREGR